MQDSLIIWLPVQADAPLHWGLYIGGDITETGVSSVSEASHLSEWSLPICLIIPGQNIRSFEHELPKLNRREREQAVLYSLEDKISTPLEKLHAAFGGDASQFVSLIDKTYLETIINWAVDIGLALHKVIPDYHALSSNDENQEIFSLSDRVVQAGQLGHTLDTGWAKDSTNWITPSQAMTLSAPNMGEATNLLQGTYAPKTSFGSLAKTGWQIGGLAAALGLAVLFFESQKTHALQAEAKNLKAQTAALYTERTGQAAPINPARAVAQITQNGQVTPTQFLTLSDISFRALANFEDVRIERVTYQNNRNELQMRLIYPSFERADEVQRAMTEAGGLFIPGGVREQSGQFIGEAVLKIAGAS